MEFAIKIQNHIQSKQMLYHPFYQDWMAGRLSQKQLQNYAVQYLPFVDSFPRFVSATHSLCDSDEGRKMLLENLMDEEGVRDSAPHPKLWRDFAAGIGANLSKKEAFNTKAQELEAVFFSLCRSSYEEGLCALYAYEYQIPEIAKVKIQGLAQNYKIKDTKTISFFSVHQQADIYHSQGCARLINKIEEDKMGLSLSAAKKASESLWDFLTEVHH